VGFIGVARVVAVVHLGLAFGCIAVEFHVFESVDDMQDQFSSDGYGSRKDTYVLKKLR
jgi:hypothetical protein